MSARLPGSTLSESAISDPVPRLSGWWWLVIALPIALQVFCSWWGSVNLPFADDFDIVLDAVNRPQAERWSRMFARHNEHRILFARLSVELVYLLTGKADLVLLMTFGNVVHLIAIGIWIGVARRTVPAAAPSWWFPIAWLILFPYPELNSIWTTSSLQNLTIHTFAGCALASSRRYPWWATAWALFGAFSSANGILLPLLLMFDSGLAWWFSRGTVMVPMALGEQTPRRRLFWRVPILALGFAACFLAPGQSQGGTWVSPTGVGWFWMTLLGSPLEVLHPMLCGPAGVVVFGLCLVLLVPRKDWQSASIVRLLLLFELGSSLMIALRRSGFGVDYALMPRFRPVVCFLWATQWILVAEFCLQRWPTARWSHLVPRFATFGLAGLYVVLLPGLLAAGTYIVELRLAGNLRLMQGELDAAGMLGLSPEQVPRMRKILSEAIRQQVFAAPREP